MSKKSSIDEIQNAIDDFVSGLPELQKKQFDKVYSILKDVSTDSDGNIKPTIENLKIINRVKSQLSGLVDNERYINKVSDLNDAIEKINVVQTAYFAKAFDNFTKPKSIDKLQDLAFDSTVEQLTEAGINENVINESIAIVENHIKDSSSFFNMVDELKVQMLGDKKIDSKLISYAKQVINDTLSGFSRNYDNIVTADLNLEWFEYIGALVDTSRPFCKALTKKFYVHKSELNKIARGEIDGKDISLVGLFPGTNGHNLINNAGGYNCSHKLIPVPASVIPTEIRRKFEPDIKPDNKEKASLRPKRK